MATKFVTKNGYNSDCIENIDKVLAPCRGFMGLRYRIMPDKFYHDWPPLPQLQNVRQNRLYFSLYNRYLDNRGHSGSGYAMMSVKKLRRPTLLPWQRNLKQKRL